MTDSLSEVWLAQWLCTSYSPAAVRQGGRAANTARDGAAADFDSQAARPGPGARGGFGPAVGPAALWRRRRAVTPGASAAAAHRQSVRRCTLQARSATVTVT